MSTQAAAAGGADLERRFGGLRRLYGDAAYTRLRAARFVVVGLGGVGSWAAEALARSGAAALTLIDLDHVAESNVNRQVQALGSTLGRHKGEALAERLADIHPGCTVRVVDAFVSAENAAALLAAQPFDVLLDACDDARAKLALATWALAHEVPTVCVGAAGGKRAPQGVEVADLAETTHDPLLARLRQRLRHTGAAPRSGRIGLRCVFSREPVSMPAAEAASGDGGAPACEPADRAPTDGSLNCAGYGSSVTVTATFGLVAAAQAIEALRHARHNAGPSGPAPA